MPEVVIPPTIVADVVTTIIDTSCTSILQIYLFSKKKYQKLIKNEISIARPEHRDILENEIQTANVICCVYAVNKTETFDRITSYWLPFIRGLGVNVPVILVGNKSDTRLGENQSLEDVVLPIMNEWKVYLLNQEMILIFFFFFFFFFFFCQF